MDAILVVNAGSSSLKFQVFGIEEASGLSRVVKGQMDGIGTRPRLRAEGADGAAPDRPRPIRRDRVADLPAAIGAAGSLAARDAAAAISSPSAIGSFMAAPNTTARSWSTTRSSLISSATISLAPLHQPNNLAPDPRAAAPRGPNCLRSPASIPPSIAAMSALADHYAIPERLYAEGVRRYGFHGLSYEYVAERLRQVAPDVAIGRVIVAHLGSGASMCALSAAAASKARWALPRSTGCRWARGRDRSIPASCSTSSSRKGMTRREVQDLLYRECGLKGLSGISNDVRELEASDDPRAAFALDYFVYRIGLHAGMLAAALGRARCLRVHCRHRRELADDARTHR